jgi:hypothetical protein
MSYPRPSLIVHMRQLDCLTQDETRRLSGMTELEHDTAPASLRSSAESRNVPLSNAMKITSSSLQAKPLIGGCGAPELEDEY